MTEAYDELTSFAVWDPEQAGERENAYKNVSLMIPKYQKIFIRQ